MGQVVDFYAAAWPNFTPALTDSVIVLPLHDQNLPCYSIYVIRPLLQDFTALLQKIVCTGARL